MEFTDAEVPQEETQSSEKNDGDPKIVVELGFHGSFQNNALAKGHSENIEYSEKTHPEELVSHIWNEEVGDRLSEVQPKVLSIDSIGKTQLLNGDYHISAKRRIWNWLPTSPKELNSSGQVYVVTGDTDYSDLDSAYSLYLNQPGKSHTEENDYLQDFTKTFHDKTLEKIDDVQKEAVVNTAAGVGAGLLLAEILRRAAKSDDSVQIDNSLDNPEEVTKEGHHGKSMFRQELSRRKMLKWGARTIAGATVAFHGAKIGALALAPKAPNNMLENASKYVMELTSGGMVEDTWLDGRTALMIAHCNEALKYKLIPENSTGAVVMGSAHGFAANRLTESRQARQDAIYEYVKSLQGFLDETLDKFPKIPRDLVHDILIDIVCRPQLISITDLGEDANGDPEKALEKHVKFEKELESEEVVEAVQNLRRDQYVF